MLRRMRPRTSATNSLASHEAYESYESYKPCDVPASYRSRLEFSRQSTGSNAAN